MPAPQREHVLPGAHTDGVAGQAVGQLVRQHPQQQHQGYRSRSQGDDHGAGVGDQVEAWLRGPIDGISDWLQPAAHALLQAYQELETAADTVPEDRLWERPGGAASVGFHLLHVVGSTDRLLTYARGEQLNDEQMAELRAESTPPDPPPGVDELLIRLDQAVDRMFDVLRETPDTALLEPRGVGRKQLPTNVLGILMHAAEHAQRHAGQAVTTAKVLANA